MPTRLIVAYVLIAALVLAAVLLYARARYNSHARRYNRRQVREDKDYSAKMKAGDPSKGMNET